MKRLPVLGAPNVRPLLAHHLHVLARCPGEALLISSERALPGATDVPPPPPQDEDTKRELRRLAREARIR